MATHTLKAVQFASPGGAGSVSVPLAEFELPLAQVQTEAYAQLSTSRAGATKLALGQHWFGLPYGTLAYRAFNQGLEQERGADFQGVVAELFDCPGLASSVAKRCVLGICVGHTRELREVCEQGLEEIVSRTQEKFESMNFEAVRFERGDAELALAAPQAKNITEREVRLVDGTWQASVDLGQGPRSVTATFDLAPRIEQPE